jgi:23S rRNA (adenine2030-N6)-methyltransferase
MNYRHLYHAGNFADVFKHVVLMHALRALQRKEKGLAYFETHAGAGRYDLRTPEAQKTGEAADGIGRLWSHAPLPGLEDYLAAVQAQNRGAGLRFYPGSPCIALPLLRPQDRMRLAELEPSECERLQQQFYGDHRVAVECVDGYAALKAWLPPVERRGLILIDPPYEEANEWTRLRTSISEATRRFAQGVYLVWYPLKVGIPIARFKSDLAASGLRRILIAEMNAWPTDSPFRLNGCGMMIINPPWQLDDELRAILPLLAQRLAQTPEANARVEWLVPE